jgi:hypothetical protein
MSPTIVESVDYFDTTTEIWKDLRERFSHGDMFRIADLQEDLHSAKQGDNSVTQFYTILKFFGKKLINFTEFSYVIALLLVHVVF